MNEYGRKVRPYLEYRYININTTKSPELLEQVNRIWHKHAEGCVRGLERARERLRRIAEVPEAQMKKHIDQFAGSIEYKMQYGSIRKKESIDKIVGELKREGNLPEQYNTDYKYIGDILEQELFNNLSIP